MESVEEDGGRAEGAPLLDVHRSQDSDGAAAELESYLQICVYALDDPEQMRRQVEMSGQGEENIPRSRAERLHQVYEEHPGLLLMLLPLLQSLDIITAGCNNTELCGAP